MSELPGPKKIFLDADIVIQEGRPPGGPLLGRLKSLVADGVVTVLTTDLTCQQIAKKHTENDYNIIKELGRPHFRKVVKEVVGTTLPKTTKSELKAKLVELRSRATKDMFKALRCKTLAIDNVKPSTVFSAYAADEGFFTGEGKKNQFADAFIFECIKAEVANGEPVIIVSDDGDFDKPVKGEDNISLVKSLRDLFETLGLQADKRQITSFLEHHEEEFIKAADDALRFRSFIVEDVNNAEIDDVEVTEVEVLELTNFGSVKKGEPILVVGNLSVVADVSYSHPDWGSKIWDKEERRYIDLTYDIAIGTTAISFAVEVSMLVMVDKDGKPESIEELRSRDDSFLYVDIGVIDPFP